ncbi:mechanosensitive ion channel family protein [Candidatus Uhrbacteria bacterium]|nr:mechanosensitive ion channel family protein [Candidatus Uhrbacteria bacterium]
MSIMFVDLSIMVHGLKHSLDAQRDYEYSEHMLNELFSQTFFGIPLANYAQAGGVFLAILVAYAGIRAFALYRIKRFAAKTPTHVDDGIVEAVQSLKGAAVLVAAASVVAYLYGPEGITRTAAYSVLVSVVTIQAVITSNVIIRALIGYRAKKESGETRTLLGIAGKAVQIGIWAIGALMVLSNLGINVSSLIAGLGIGGIAIALAVQNILGDLFSSFAIYFDKPFAVGDFIVAGDKMGTVERIGLKTTRIRALQGEEIVIANQDLLKAQIRNFKKMRERRVLFTFGIAYETPTKTVERVSEIVKEILSAIDDVRYDRAHFSSFGDSSLNFEVVYYLKNSDYNRYMDVQQEINLNLKAALEKARVEFAYPTRTVYLRQVA